MTNNFLLDWALMAVSLFNTILPLWLGLTVLLNAERRNWSIWLAGGGMIMASAFFVPLMRMTAASRPGPTTVFVPT